MSVLGFNAAFTKQPSEQITIRANFTDVASTLVITGYSLNNCEVKIYDNTGGDTGNNMIQGSPTVDSNNSAVLVCIKAGNDGANYYGRFRTTWSANNEINQTIERDLLIKIRSQGY